MSFDGAAFGREVVQAVRGYMERERAEMAARIDALERRFAAAPAPRDGRDADMDAVRAHVEELGARLKADVDTRFAAFPVPKDGADGKDADPAEMRVAVVEEVAKAVGAIPAPRDGQDGAPGQDGRDADPAEIKAMVDAAVAALPPPRDGQDGEPGRSVTAADLAPLVAEEVERRFAALPVPKDGEPGRDGADADMDALMARVDAGLAEASARMAEGAVSIIDAEVEKRFAELPVPVDGADGKDADPAEVARLLEEPVAERLKTAIPPPRDGQDGKDADMDALRVYLSAQVLKAAAAIPVPKDGRDGVGLTGAVVDHDGRLVLTLSDGTVKELARVVGRDGTDVDMGTVERRIDDAVAKIPAPRDGRDGFGFDDLSVEHDGERGLVLRFARGEETKEFPITLPAVLDRGVWREGSAYAKGDGVTWGGCYWIAQADGAAGRPGEQDAQFRMAVKKGRDGKDYAPPRPPPGPVRSPSLAPRTGG